MEIANDVIRFLMVVNIGVGLFAFVMAWRQQYLKQLPHQDEIEAALHSIWERPIVVE